MGRAIARSLHGAGVEVTLYDPFEDALTEARASFEDGRISIDCSGDLETALHERQLVIEAVPEVLHLKRDTLARVSATLADAVIATNTSGFRVSELAEAVTDPSRFVGTHFFNPADVAPLVEVVAGEQTSPATVDWVVHLLEATGKHPVRVERDIPGFIANRLQHALWREAFALVGDGVCSAETIDAVVLQSFGPRLGVMGPMEHADYIGLDLLANVQSRLLPQLESSGHVSSVLSDLIEKGRLGRKTGSGFGHWTPERDREAGDRLRSHLSASVMTNINGDEGNEHEC